MTLEKIVYSLEEQLRLLGRQLLSADPLAPVHEQIERLNEDERTLERGLKSWQLDLVAAQKSLNDRQIAAALLTNRIEACVNQGQGPDAYRLALDLDLLRKKIAEESELLPRLEQTCWSLQFRIRQLRRQRDELRKKLV
jgi:hypothetical protein